MWISSLAVHILTFCELHHLYAAIKLLEKYELNRYALHYWMVMGRCSVGMFLISLCQKLGRR